MYKKLATISAIALMSTSALAGGSHEGYTGNGNYNDNTPTDTNTYSNNMTNMNIMGNPTFFYLGGELGWLNADPSGGFTGDDNFWTIAPVAGLRIGQYFGIETNYTWSTSEDDVGGDVDIQSYAVDAMGYLPISSDMKWELVGTVGYGHYDFDTAIPGDDSDEALRYGGGLQYNINPQWSTRVLYRRADVETSALDGVDTVTLGLTYNFR